MIKTVIVDDEPNIREGLKLIINWEELGFEIIGEASNGRAALTLIKETMPDLIITDIKMPELTGLELIKECKKIGKEFSYIILSGHSEFEMAKKALHMGVSNYLLKPIDEIELEETLTEIKSTQKTDDLILKATLRKL